MPVIPAPREAEAEESFEPGSQRLWSAEIMPLCSSLGYNRETQSKKLKNKGQVRWHVPVIPATQEAEAGELPEPRRQRLR